MISTAQTRAARGLLKWTQAALAHRAGLSTVTLNMIENDAVHPQRWLAKFGQSDKWKICLKAAIVPRIRSEHGKTSTAVT